MECATAPKGRGGECTQPPRCCSSRHARVMHCARPAGLPDIEGLNRKLDQRRAATDSSSSYQRQALGSCLAAGAPDGHAWPAGLPDIERLTRKLERRRIGLADLCQLYRASSRLPLVEQALREHEGGHAELLVSR